MRKRIFCLVSSLVLLSAVPVHAKQNIKLNKTFITLPTKNTYTLKVNGTKKKVKWSSCKKKIAAVNKDGKITAKKPGTTYIIAKVNGKKIKCKVSVRNNKSITYKLHDAYDWQCEDIWNNGYCDIYHYIEDGTNSVGEKMDINKTISRLNTKCKKRSSNNKYVYSVQGKRYSNFKKTWKKLDGQTVRLKQILDKNGAPTPKSNYYFPYQRYDDYLNDLMGYNLELSFLLLK